MKKHLWLKILLGIMAVLILAFGVLVAYLTITEYSPKERQAAEYYEISDGKMVSQNEQLTIYTWNIGYAGLDASTDFFMDGGSEVNPETDDVEKNLAAIQNFISSHTADAWFLQEVDVNSSRTGYINELSAIKQAYQGSFGLAYNYKCAFVPLPIPPIGKVECGIATFTDCSVKNDAFERIALPCPFSWPVSVANLKRCLLVTRLNIEESDKELVLVNLHLEAYDDGEGKLAQTKMLTEFLQKEYEKGNYVIAGGDFNQSFPGTLNTYPLKEDAWIPGILEEQDLPEGFQYVFDEKKASCRLLNRPLDENSQMYILDGFIVSANVQVELVETQELGFANSDHNPVKLQVTLLPY